MTKVIPPFTPPTVQEVAALLRARTKDLTGNEIGDFTDDTRPTGDEVMKLIELAYGEVCGQAGAYLAQPCASLAGALTAIRAAMWVELSYFPEQVRSDRSVYTELAAQWEQLLPSLITCAEGNLPGGGGGPDPATSYRFGVLDVHGWTASPLYGAPDVPLIPEPAPEPDPEP